MSKTAILETRPPSDGGELPPRNHLGGADDGEYYSRGERSTIDAMELQMANQAVEASGLLSYGGRLGLHEQVRRSEIAVPLGRVSLADREQQVDRLMKQHGWATLN